MLNEDPDAPIHPRIVEVEVDGAPWVGHFCSPAGEACDHCEAQNDE